MSTISERDTPKSSEPAHAATPKRRATILDVARAADVAPSTVSLVTNGTGYVSAERRRLIEEVVRRVGYQPRGRRKAAARATQTPAAGPAETASERAMDVVMIYVPVPARPGAATETVLAVLDGANATFTQRQIRPSLVAAANHIEEDVILLSHLRSRPLDGALLIGLGGSTGQSYVQHLREAGIPTVLVGHREPTLGVSSVNADFFRGSVAITQHLLGLGHRRIGFVGLSPDHWPTVQRQQGYEQAVRARDLAIEEPFFMSGLDATNRKAAMKTYLEAALGRGCTGFAMGDFHAQFAVPILEELGLKVPGEVSVAGFDSLGLKAGRQSLDLTSVSYDKQFLGTTAVQTLLEIIESGGRLAAADKTISVGVHAGSTTAKAPASFSA